MNKHPSPPDRRRKQTDSTPRRQPEKERRSANADASPPQKRSAPHPAAHRPSGAAKAARAKASNRDRREYYLNDNGGSTGNTAVSSLVKAIVFIVSILVISGFLSYFVISIGNDVFALVKQDNQTEISIDDHTTIEQLGVILEDYGVIEYAEIFNLYAMLRGRNSELVAGTYTVSSSMNYDQLIATFARKVTTTRTTVVVVIPEGYTVDQIIHTLVHKYGLSSEEELIDAIQNYDFDYWFVDELVNLRYGRKYRLEGYLYPDTYYYYSDASAVTIINKMLANFDTKMKQVFRNCAAEGNDYREKIANLCRERNLSFDDIIILASMIQKEAIYDIEYSTISSVFNNRIKNPSVTNGLLGSDATIYYVLEDPPKELTTEHLNIDSPYNTRRYPGLPPGSISNPTYLAINYAFYPEPTNYYYFVAKKSGYSLFASTYQQHLKNCEIAAKEEEED
ncbi:MAG: endolytic transglycosylase MltG [Ruminococcaceae bacterium]|nr:endolytic transglycosylase MltG [Oscillospiraceae bacterium]